MRKPKIHVIKPSDTSRTLCGKATGKCMAQGWFRGLAKTRAIAKRRGLDLCETCLRNASSHCEAFSDRKLWPDNAVPKVDEDSRA